MTTMSNDPKKGTPEAEEKKKDSELSEDELDEVSGGTAANVSPALKKALERAGQRPMG